MAESFLPTFTAKASGPWCWLTEAASNKESWEKQARTLATSGFRVLAVDFRGYGKSKGPGDSEPMNAPLYLDVWAAVRYLRKAGARTVSVVGGSMGGAAAGDAAIDSPGEIARVVFLGASPDGPAEKLRCPSLFIVARDDRNAGGARLPAIRAQYEKLRNRNSCWSSKVRRTRKSSLKPTRQSA